MWVNSRGVCCDCPGGVLDGAISKPAFFVMVRAKKLAGRPSVYTDEIAEEILMRLAEGESLRAICRDDHTPNISTITLWVVDDREGFSARYARARAAQAMRLADEIIEIADEDERDTNRDRLRVDTRKWYLSKVLPKVYGDTKTVEVRSPEQSARAIHKALHAIDGRTALDHSGS